MAVQFRNKEDTRRYAAAEDAFTSEGGYLALEDDALEQDRRTDRVAPHPSRDFRAVVHRYAAGMEAVLAVFRRGGSLLVLRSANHSDR